MALARLDRFAPELIELLVENAFEANSHLIQRGYEAPATVVFVNSSEKKGNLERFQVWRDLLNLSATCKYLRRVIAPMVHRYDIKFNHSSALLLSAKMNNTAGIAMALNHGADIHEGDRTTATSWTLGNRIGEKR